MANYSMKIEFERKIVDCINSEKISSTNIIGLSEKAISDWSSNLLNNDNAILVDYIKHVAKQYGFIIDESNALKKFTNKSGEIDEIIQKIHTANN